MRCMVRAAVAPPPPGTYRVGRQDGRKVPVVACPGCGERWSLPDFTVARDGTVRPAINCDRCDFHDVIQLEQWPGDIR